MVMKVLASIRTVLSHRNYLLLLLLGTVFFWILFAYLTGLDRLPWLDWDKLQNAVLWEVFLPSLLFILVAGLLNSLLLCLTVFRLKELQARIAGKETPASVLGIGLTGIFAACPFCGVSVVSVFGFSFVSNVIAPYFAGFQLLALLIVLVALYWTSNKIGAECENCSIKSKKPHKHFK